MYIKRIIYLLLLIANIGYTQTAPFEITIEPLTVPGLSGIQSYAFGQANGKWLIVGGRLDGLHRRQPNVSFDIAGNNNQLIVVDPVTLQTWQAPLTTLPTSIQEQLSSTNMEFYQENDYLYCIGGYGYSPTVNDHTTHNKLTAIEVSDVINAVINNTSLLPYFRQITDNQFQVTGGRLKKINSTYYLLGGQKFIGRYNPQGPNNGPGFIQEYTNAIRKFNLVDDGVNIAVTHLTPHIDIANLHRRDYNAEQQILPNGDEGITMFSGVFQPNVNLPFLNSVTVDDSGYAVNNTFQQYYNHYHCPVLPIYSELDNEMHTIFFGGIAQFYDNDGVLVQDDNVPFVNTIARVTRDSNGDMAEYKLPIEMPSLLGSGAEFIPNLSFPHFDNEVFKLDDVMFNDTLIGYIYGGISSSQPNIFFTNDGTQSDASSQIFKVLIKKSTLSVDEFNTASTSNLNLVVYPNPNKGKLNISFNLIDSIDATLTIHDLKGAIINNSKLKNMKIGKNLIEREIPNFIKGGVYFVTVETLKSRMTYKVITKR